MAYVPTYQIEFENKNRQEVIITFSKLNGIAGTITKYKVTDAKISYDGDEGKFGCLYGMSLECSFRINDGDVDCRLDFVSGTKWQWMCSVTVDGAPYFSGFVLSDDSGVPFQDKPYTYRVTAVDGIGLLKDERIEQEQFTAHHSFISIASYCFRQTGLTLPIRVFDNYYNFNHANRDADINADMWSQTYLEYRTLQEDATTFENCYDALEIMMKNTHRAFQWNGMWVIIRLSMMQYFPLVGYYTDYDANGQNPVGQQILENYASVGKNAMVFPINKNQVLYTKRAVKSETTNFDYRIWPEIPKNNKFERGGEIAFGTAYDETDIDGDGNFSEVIGTYKTFVVEDWEYGWVNILQGPTFPLTHASASAPNIRRISNVYGVEISREVMLHAGGDGITSGEVWMRSEAIPVIEGDLIKFSVDKRWSNNFEGGSFDRTAIIYVVSPSGKWYYLNGTSPTSDNYGKWFDTGIEVTTTFIEDGFIIIHFTEDDDKRKWQSVSIESAPIPINGNLYIALINSTRTSHNQTQFFRNLEFEYMPMVAGGFRAVKGDSEKITQATDYKDKSEREIFVDNNPHKVFKGCLLDSDGIPLPAQWYKMGVAQYRRYKQWVNYDNFNLEHRQMDMIEGDFKTIFYNIANNPTQIFPIGFHKQYRFTDLAGDDTRFILSPPMDINLNSCRMVCRFYELYDDAHIHMDGRTNGTEELKYRF